LSTTLNSFLEQLKTSFLVIPLDSPVPTPAQLSDATYQNKRAVMDKLDLKAVFRVDDGARWLDLTCSLSPEGLSYDLQENNCL
jgi:hypothetical protein